MWAIRMTYSLPGQDVLSKYMNGLENIFELAGSIYVSEPGAIDSWVVYVSDDLSYAETYLRWPSQAAWLELEAVYGEDWREMMEICDRQLLSRVLQSHALSPSMMIMIGLLRE